MKTIIIVASAPRLFTAYPFAKGGAEVKVDERSRD